MARLQKKSRRQSPQVQPRHPGIPRAMVFTLIRDLPGVRLVSHRRPRDHRPRTWRQRRGARTTRLRVRKLPFVHASLPALRHPAATASRTQRSVTIAKRPSRGARDGDGLARFLETRNRNFQSATSAFSHARVRRGGRGLPLHRSAERKAGARDRSRPEHSDLRSASGRIWMQDVSTNARDKATSAFDRCCRKKSLSPRGTASPGLVRRRGHLWIEYPLRRPIAGCDADA